MISDSPIDHDNHKFTIELTNDFAAPRMRKLIDLALEEIFYRCVLPEDGDSRPKYEG